MSLYKYISITDNILPVIENDQPVYATGALRIVKPAEFQWIYIDGGKPGGKRIFIDGIQCTKRGIRCIINQNCNCEARNRIKSRYIYFEIELITDCDRVWEGRLHKYETLKKRGGAPVVRILRNNISVTFCFCNAIRQLKSLLLKLTLVIILTTARSCEKE